MSIFTNTIKNALNDSLNNVDVRVTLRNKTSVNIQESAMTLLYVHIFKLSNSYYVLVSINPTQRYITKR